MLQIGLNKRPDIFLNLTLKDDHHACRESYLDDPDMNLNISEKITNNKTSCNMKSYFNLCLCFLPLLN